MKIFARAVVLLYALMLAPDALAAKVAQKKGKGPWGAVAYDSKTGAFGFASDFASKRAAESEAFRLCGSDCDILKSFRDTCGAIAARPRRAVSDTGASRAIAERKALTKCGGDACKIAVWACTTPK